ncbi:MAG: proline dehydrogenase family protein [Thermodesulfobacteriota bacterium]
MKGFTGYLAGRYIAGTERGDAIEVCRELNEHGLAATIDILGEGVTEEKHAEAAVTEYHSLLDEIQSTGIESSISLKLTHLGLDISRELTEKNLRKILRKARDLCIFVRLDMERSKYTEETMSIFLKLHEDFPDTGIAIQSALVRSPQDIKTLISARAKVRLVKGAYMEPPGIGFQEKKLVDINYTTLMKRLLLSGAGTAIATHDEAIINEARDFTLKNKISKEDFEFQMLLGIKRTLQKKLAEEGYKVRVYVPYGKDWMAYVLRRLKERKENIYFVVRNLLD